MDTYTPTTRGIPLCVSDVLKVVEACLQGQLPLNTRRFNSTARNLIQSGDIFVVKTSDVSRWTDGINWGPSRIYGSFLVYRQLEDDVRSAGKVAARAVCQGKKNSEERCRDHWDELARIIEHPYMKDGLLKITMNVPIVKGGIEGGYRLICYYLRREIPNRHANRVTTLQGWLKNVTPRSELFGANNYTKHSDYLYPASKFSSPSMPDSQPSSAPQPLSASPTDTAAIPQVDFAPMQEQTQEEGPTMFGPEDTLFGPEGSLVSLYLDLLQTASQTGPQMAPQLPVQTLDPAALHQPQASLEETYPVSMADNIWQSQHYVAQGPDTSPVPMTDNIWQPQQYMAQGPDTSPVPMTDNIWQPQQYMGQGPDTSLAPWPVTGCGPSWLDEAMGTM